jgi:hypothetical protein
MFSNNWRPPLKKCENVRRHCDAVYFSMKALQKILGGKGKITALVKCRKIPKFEHEPIRRQKRTALL